MKYAFLIAIAALFACNPGSKSNKIQPDTCYTQIHFKNIYAGGYPAPPADATAIRVIFDSLHVGDEKNFHKLDTVYYVGYTFPVLDSARKFKLHKKNDVLMDSTTTVYYPITPKDILVDYNHVDPFHPVFPIPASSGK